MEKNNRRRNIFINKCNHVCICVYQCNSLFNLLKWYFFHSANHEGFKMKDFQDSSLISLSLPIPLPVPPFLLLASLFLLVIFEALL